MAITKYNARVVQKHDTKANWDKATNFIPLKGEIIVYDDLNKIKIGDGVTKVGNLSFVQPSPADIGLGNVNNTSDADKPISSATQAALNQKLNLSGGAMTGNLTFATTKGIKYAAEDNDTQLWQVYDGSGAYGYALQYNGSGSGNNNDLVLISDNQSGTKINAVTMKQDGTTTFAKKITASGGISGNLTGNADTATKLATARTIALDTGATGTATSFDGSANITIPVTDVKEAYLSWGGRSLSGSVSPIGMALSEEHSGNKTAFINGNAITIEYSTDGGSTYTDSGISATNKSALFTSSCNVNVGGSTAMTSSNYSNLKTRITLTGQDGTNQYFYSDIKKVLVNVSTAVKISMLVETLYGNSSTWTTYGTYTLVGWSGWNDVPLNFTLGGSTSQKDRPWKVRFTMSLTGYSTSYSTTKTILGFRVFGQNSWYVPSTLGRTGHLYSYDMSQNVTFPAGVTATTFTGSLSGNASTATTATKLGTSAGSATQPIYFSDGKPVATTYTLGKSVPSDAKFTDTTYSAAGTSLGLVKSGGDVTISSGTITVNDDSHNHTIANVDNLQSSLDAKVPTSRTVNGKALSSSISLTASDVGAAASSHTHSYAGSPSAGGGANSLAIFDTRDVNNTPTEITNLIGKGARLDFKQTNTVGLSNGTYAAVLSISPWSDVSNWSGGKNTQLGFCDDGRIQVRKGNGSGWSSWNTLIDSSTISSQSVNYATSAGSAATATKATQDASGNTITSTYATKTEVNAKQATITGAATTITGSNLTASRALVSDSSGKVAVSAVTSTELGYLDGVTSAIQTQLNGKAPAYTYGTSDLTAGTSSLTTGTLYFVYE